MSDDLESMRSAILLLNEAHKVADLPGINYEFTCPACGSEAHAVKARENGHVHAWCSGCGIEARE